jgi:hypothetical protein
MEQTAPSRSQGATCTAAESCGAELWSRLRHFALREQYALQLRVVAQSYGADCAISFSGNNMHCSWEVVAQSSGADCAISLSGSNMHCSWEVVAQSSGADCAISLSGSNMHCSWEVVAQSGQLKLNKFSTNR